MHLTQFEVTMFRNVIDSGSVAVDPEVTCLVGKNESGKTALLNALYRLNPVTADQFDATKQYPRWRYSRDKKSSLVEAVEPITATFTLDPTDTSALNETFGDGVVIGQTFEVTRSYNNELKTVVAVNPQTAGLNVLEALGTPAELRNAIADKQMANILSQVEALDDGPDWTHDDIAAIVREIRSRLNGTSSTAAAVKQFLLGRLPKFFYFSDYQMLPGRVDLREIGGSETPAGSGIQTARALIKLASTDVSAISNEDFEDRKAELEAVSNELTQQVFKYWKQNEDLSVVIDIDMQTENTNYGPTAVARYLDIRVRDARHGFTNNFDQRSSGFRWFFSFLAAFSEFSDHEHGVIVLLDEPALTLHGRAQADFLDYIDKVLSKSVQVIYTTHSPFMVEPSRLDRVRIVEDQGPDIGAIASDEVLRVADDSLFPLQAALGYDIAQNLYVGPDNLVVEGTSDFTYLTVLSDHLASIGRESLDSRWRILPAGGATNIPALVALVGRDLDVTTLIDGTPSSIAKLNGLSDRGLLERKRIFVTDTFTGVSPSDIEDMFDPKEYIDLYAKAFKTRIAASKLTGADRIISRISRATGTAFEKHGVPADYLLRNRDAVLPTLSSATLDKFEALFTAINETLK